MSFFHRINRTISNERFAAYKIQGGDDASAFSKYLWNVALCESLYPALNIIEVAYRNATHTAICATPIGADWLKQEIQILHSPEIEKIQEAKNNLKRRCKTVTEAYLVSELSFGFWDSLLNSRYETLWHKIIKDVFPKHAKADTYPTGSIQPHERNPAPQELCPSSSLHLALERPFEQARSDSRSPNVDLPIHDFHIDQD